MSELDYVSYNEVKNLKIERDVLEKIFSEKSAQCDEFARRYYNQQKERIMEVLKKYADDQNDVDEKMKKQELKKAQKDLERLCIQFGHDAPMPSDRKERVRCRCCKMDFSFDELIESYYRKTRFARMIIFDYIKQDHPFELSDFDDE